MLEKKVQRIHFSSLSTLENLTKCYYFFFILECFRIGRRDENSEPLTLFTNTNEEKITFLATAKQAVKEYFKEHQDQLEMEGKIFLSIWNYFTSF